MPKFFSYKIHSKTVLVLAIIIVFPLATFLLLGLAVVAVEDGYRYFDEYDFRKRLHTFMESGKEEIYVSELTDFEWDKVCRIDGYQDTSESPYVWDLVFYRDDVDGSYKSYTFEVLEYGYGYVVENYPTDYWKKYSIPEWCVHKERALLTWNSKTLLLIEAKKEK